MSDVGEAVAGEAVAGVADELVADEVAADEVAAPAAETDPRGRALIFVGLPVVVVLLGGAAGYLTWENSSRRDAEAAAGKSVVAASEATTAMLSYRADTVESDLAAARDRLTGSFLDSYTQLVNDVVIPGAKERKISAGATVAAAASVSATPAHAVALLFVNQTVTMGGGAPTSTASSVRVTLDKVGDRWLVSGFEPV